VPPTTRPSERTAAANARLFLPNVAFIFLLIGLTLASQSFLPAGTQNLGRKHVCNNINRFKTNND
jgi:hypothetical protein